MDCLHWVPDHMETPEWRLCKALSDEALDGKRLVPIRFQGAEERVVTHESFGCVKFTAR